MSFKLTNYVIASEITKKKQKCQIYDIIAR